jgi:hypothetical protein
MQNVQILFPNASKVGSGGDLVPGENSVTFDINEVRVLASSLSRTPTEKATRTVKRWNQQPADRCLREGRRKMVKIVAILVLAALATIAISLGLAAAALDILTAPATLDTPPLMYAGIRG